MNRTERLEVRLTPQEARMISAIAAEKGVTITSHIVHSAIPNYAKVIKKPNK